MTAGTYPSIHIDLGSNEPDMTLQYRHIERGYIVWRDYTVDGEAVKSPLNACLIVKAYELEPGPGHYRSTLSVPSEYADKSLRGLPIHPVVHQYQCEPGFP